LTWHTCRVALLKELFALFEIYDEDGNGCIDKDEYWNVR
jgi:Ca2+-binding EF-hand superfamily protein